MLAVLLAGCGRDLPAGVPGHGVLLVAGGDGVGWSALLGGSFGGHDVVPAGDFLGSPVELSRGRALVVLDRSATARATPALLAALGPAMEAGLALLLVQPGEELAGPLGLVLASRDEVAQLAWPAPPGPSWTPVAARPPLPLAHTVYRYHPASGQGPRSELLAAPAGRAVLWRHLRGSGGAWVLALPLGELASSRAGGAAGAAHWWERLLEPGHWPWAPPSLGPAPVAGDTAMRFAVSPAGSLELRLAGPAGQEAELWLPVQRGVAAMAGWEGEGVRPLGRREGPHGPERGFALPADGGELRVGYTRF